MPEILLHTCCAPCSTFTVKHLRAEGWQPTALWYNPNIHPFQEHQRRLETMQGFTQRQSLPLVIVEGYDMIAHLRAVVGREEERCIYCFRLRLGRAAATARQKGCGAFTTTLLISPYQKHDLLREIGLEVAKAEGVEFVYEDLRSGYTESRQMSRELGLYRQQYCGCVYSEWERFGKVAISRNRSLG